MLPRALVPCLFLAGLVLPAASARADVPTKPLVLEACRVDGVANAARCGTLEVFEDRERRTGRKIALRVVVLPAIASKPEPDPLFFLAGGPGQAASELAGTVAPIFQRVRERRDLVFVDQRGTGSSNPLDCELHDPDDLASAFEMDSYPLEKLRECRERWDADPRLYTTPLAMDDLDDVRAALGYPRVNLYGGSYGTRAALVYLRRHPERVRAIVLDGSAPVAMRLPLPVGDDAERALTKLFSDCAADASCNAAFPRLEETFHTLLRELEAAPRTVRLKDPRTAEEVSLTMTADALAGGVRAALYSGELSSLLPLAITRASEGDWSSFVALVGAFASDGISIGMFLSVVCAEDVPRIGDEERARALEGSRLGRSGIRSILDACAEWPIGTLPDDYAEPVRSDVPVLALSGDLDPVTPPRWGDEAIRGLTRARHIVAPGTGHGVFGRGCAPRVLASFLASADPDVVDDSCIQELRRPPAFVTPNGPVPRPVRPTKKVAP